VEPARIGAPVEIKLVPGTDLMHPCLGAADDTLNERLKRGRMDEVWQLNAIELKRAGSAAQGILIKIRDEVGDQRGRTGHHIRAAILAQLTPGRRYRTVPEIKHAHGARRQQGPL